MGSRLIPVPSGGVTSPQGFLAGATSASIKPPAAERLDLALLHALVPCAAAAVYTTNRIKAAPLLVTQEHVADGRAQALIVNSGNANCMTGPQGMHDAREMAELAADRLRIPVGDVLVGSTGVTGRSLPMEQIRLAVPRIHPTEDGGDAFAHAIMTTDTVDKQSAMRFTHEEREYTIGGCAKGSGMIHPQMATMLAFLTTDAPLTASVLQQSLREAVDASLNMITVDGDTSTNDMAVILASGAAGGEPMPEGHPALPAFRGALHEVCASLARQLARDGEGATKLIEVLVEGAASTEDARLAARAVAGSPLVKAAINGGDPNWGRIMAAAGRSGAELEEVAATLHLQGVCLFETGTVMPVDESALAAALSSPEVHIRLHLGRGEGAATAWGCDLSTDYVRINSEYTT
jgi:glutamate N-acetyltransferase/amino-acid N-acetyltransferase